MHIAGKRRSKRAGKNRFRGAGWWQRSTILCGLKNPVYKGRYVYGKTQGGILAAESTSPVLSAL